MERDEPAPLAASAHVAAADDALVRVASSIAAAVPCAVLVFVYAVADATLLFGTAFPDRVSTGLAMALVGAAIAAAVVALLSGLRGTVAGAQGVTVIMLAVLVSDLRSSFPATADPDAVFATAVAATLVTTVAIGVACLVVARLRLGRLVHYVPWPVVAGLLAGSGIALALAALPVLVGRQSLASSIDAFAAVTDLPALGLGGIAAGAFALAARRRAPHAAMLLTLALGYACWRASSHLAGLDLETLRATGWTLASDARPLAWPPSGLVGPSLVDWGRIVARLPSIGAVVLISLLAALVKIGAVGHLLDQDVDEERELRAVGVANLAAGGAFGLSGFHAASLTQIAVRVQAARPLTGLALAALVLCMLPFAGAALAHAPRFLVGGILLWVGTDLVNSWLIRPRASLSRLELAIVVVIAGAIAAFGFLPGLFTGLGCTLVLFVIDCARIDVLRAAVPWHELRSNVDRTAAERELLGRRARELLVFRLHGYLFFGTAHRFVAQLGERIRHAPTVAEGPLHVILDFEQVTGLDASTVRALERLRAFADRRGIVLAFSNLPVDRRRTIGALLERRTRADGPSARVFDTLDAALQHREQALLGALADAGRTDRGPFVRALGQATVRDLTRYADPLAATPGQVLISQGLEAGALYIVREGRLAVRFAGNGVERRIRSVGAGAVLGELSFYLDRPASADIVAETDCRLWRLDAAGLEKMLAADPALASRFHRHVAALLAERLVDNGRQIRMLAG